MSDQRVVTDATSYYQGWADAKAGRQYGEGRRSRPIEDQVALLRRVLSEYLAGNRIVDGHWYSPERADRSHTWTVNGSVLLMDGEGIKLYGSAADARYTAELLNVYAHTDPNGNGCLAPHFKNDPATPDELALIETLRTKAGL